MSRFFAGLFLAMIAAALAIGAFAPASWQHALATDGPGCPFRAATGVNCPFCGMTRATLALGRGDLGGALGFHPLAPLVLAGFVAVLVAIVAGRTGALMRGWRPYALLAAIFAIWIARLLLQ